MRWTGLSDAEMERRRKASVQAMANRAREDFDRWYQERCDTAYWSNGPCCAGCDFWVSRGGWSGECRASGLVPAEEVLASLGIVGWSGPRDPGFPYTAGDFWCGKFRDDFDWSALPDDYLVRIGAKSGGALQGKPTHRREPDG